MAKLPYYPFYVEAFDESQRVLAMNLQQVGLYVLALNESWKRGSIPDDPLALAVLIRRKPADVKKAWPVVRSCYVENGTPGRLINERQELERIKAVSKSEKAASAARAKHASAHASASLKHSDSVADAHIRDLVSCSSSEKQKDVGFEIEQSWTELWALDPYGMNEGKAKQRFMELIEPAVNPPGNAHALVANRKEWNKYCELSESKPLGTYNWLDGGDCWKDPPAPKIKKTKGPQYIDPYREAPRD